MAWLHQVQLMEASQLNKTYHSSIFQGTMSICCIVGNLQALLA